MDQMNHIIQPGKLSSIYIIDTQKMIEDISIINKFLDILKTVEQKNIILYLLGDRFVLKYVEQYEQLLNEIYTEAYIIRDDYQFHFSIVFQSCNPYLIQQYTNEFQLFTFQPELATEQIVLVDLQYQLKGNNKIYFKHIMDQMVLTPINSYKRGANGGTFDYLHFGHKILISVSLLLVDEFLTIGITSDILHQKKMNKELIQSLNTRSKIVKDFSSLFKPSVNIDVAVLDEPAGPTKDGCYELLVTTVETQSAIKYINNLRSQYSLNSLKNYIVKILQTDTQQNKLSSSQIRQYILYKNQITAQQFEYLKNNFCQLAANQINKQIYEFYFETQIQEFYTENQRFYHTLGHINQILQLKDQNKIYLHNQRLVLVAIFFHDIIYQPKCNNNEEESVEQFIKFAQKSNDFNQQEIFQVSTYIIATKTHQLQNIEDEDLKLFLDIDLSILGQNLEQYIIYANNIRKEYKHYSDQDYCQGRIKVLKSFLQSENIFFTSQFQPMNKQAKFNIEYEINELQKQSTL